VKAKKEFQKLLKKMTNRKKKDIEKT